MISYSIYFGFSALGWEEVNQDFLFVSFHDAYLGPGRENSLGRAIQMLLSPDTSTNSSRGTPSCSQASWFRQSGEI